MFKNAPDWIKLFRVKTGNAAGYKNKYLKFAHAWIANQSNSGMDELEEIMNMGRQRKFAHHLNRCPKDCDNLLISEEIFFAL